jgi:hypothetical protein
MPNHSDISDSELRSVALLRENLWHAGFRPVPVYTVAAGLLREHEKPGKHPFGNGWQIAARRDPPAAVTDSPHFDTANTGILGDGLRPIDIDIEKPDVAARCADIACEMLGTAPKRYRNNSARRLLLYRAGVGNPQKLRVLGTFGQIEVLGRGQQFVAFGDHVSGAHLQWDGDAPGDIRRNDLTAVSEDQITSFLAAISPVIGHVPKEPAQTLQRASGVHMARRAARGGTPPEFIEARVLGLLQFVNAARVGERNSSLYWAACRLVDMIRDRELDGAAGDQAFVELCKIGAAVGLSNLEIIRTINSAAFGGGA